MRRLVSGVIDFCASSANLSQFLRQIFRLPRLPRMSRLERATFCRRGSSLRHAQVTWCAAWVSVRSVS
ncbi:hypothetical protein BOSEA31B_14436 [Hyphomicrobiales bacterium]|nr:hypothetical protein BOSEA31B_14436 [Hyphomicrobiales bacterium]CAI0343990.1 hypothetical protein BO1005MUT1_310019 [Hyphomicrobiales bacterium]